MSILRSLGFHLTNSGWYDEFVAYLGAYSIGVASQSAAAPYILHNIIGFGGFDVFGIVPEDQWMLYGAIGFTLTFLRLLPTARRQYRSYLRVRYPAYC